ncbi:hypothetical protein P3708_25835, partial [Vibrio parahaemolyticus]|nr:hypothetical protein [Vibrio parahaemolyticus]
NMVSTTWKAAIRRTLQGKTLKLEQIYKEIEPYAKHRENNHWQAKVRQVLQDARFFIRIEVGVYALAEYPNRGVTSRRGLVALINNKGA